MKDEREIGYMAEQSNDPLGSSVVIKTDTAESAGEKEYRCSFCGRIPELPNFAIRTPPQTIPAAQICYGCLGVCLDMVVQRAREQKGTLIAAAEGLKLCRELLLAKSAALPASADPTQTGTAKP